MIGRLQRQLDIWTMQNLISADQASSIQEFERDHNKKRSHRGFAMVGITAILIGILSLVASNWSQIPDMIKLIVHSVLNLSIAIAISQISVASSRGIVIRDLCVTALFGLTLTLIGLIGQVYQLHGDITLTITVWTICCAPFIWYWGRGVIAITPWLIALFTSTFLLLINLNDILHSDIFIFSFVLAFSIPILLILVSTLNRIADYRPIFSVTFLRYGMWMLSIGAVASTIFFYECPKDITVASIAIFIWLCGSISLYKDKQLQLFTFVSGFVILSSLFAGFMLRDSEFMQINVINQLLAAITFIGYFGFLAWFGARNNNNSLVDWSIRLIILRLVMIYFEVFGSLAATGFGLILTGVLILFILKNLNKIMLFGRSIVNGGRT